MNNNRIVKLFQEHTGSRGSDATDQLARTYDDYRLQYTTVQKLQLHLDILCGMYGVEKHYRRSTPAYPRIFRKFTIKIMDLMIMGPFTNHLLNYFAEYPVILPTVIQQLRCFRTGAQCLV